MSGGSDKSGDAGGRETPAAGTPAREKLPTLTNAKELEAARRKSLAEVPSSPPEGPKKNPSKSMNRASAKADPARMPSAFSLPKAPPQLVLDEFNDLDRGWGEEHGADSAPQTARVNVPEVPLAKKEPEIPAPKEPAKKPPPLPSKGAPRTASSRKMKAAAPAAPLRPLAGIVVPPPAPLPPPARPPPPSPTGRPTPLGLAAPVEPSSTTGDADGDAKAVSNAPTAPPPAAPPSTASQREAMKAYPSARSLVAAVDADALVSSLFDDGPLASAPPVASPPKATAEDAPTKDTKETKETKAAKAAQDDSQERKEKETAPAPLPGAKSPLASTLNSATGPALPPEQAASAPTSGEEGAREMRDRFSLGDYTGALEIAEKLLTVDAADQEAIDMAQNCRATLEQMYTSRIGPLDRVPVVMVPSEQLRWLSIDHRAGFVLSNIDGVSSLEMIIDVSGMTTLDALRILCELAQQRIISFR